MALALLAVPGLAFAAYSLRFGWRGLGADLAQDSYIFTPDGPGLNLSIFGHMVLGGVIMLLAPLQFSARLRARAPRLHRITGRGIAVAASAVALGGLVYIGFRGTIAGPLMDLGFALYGLLMLGAVVQTVRFARARDFARHRDWALRLVVLIMGSLIYRLHYGLWYWLADGRWSNAALTGPFDQIQYFAFYLPYLVLLEVWLRRRAGLSPARP